MSLFTATIIIAAILLIKGTILVINPAFGKQWHATFFRNPKIALLYFGSASVWVLWNIAHLGPADFGEYKVLLLILFAAAAYGSIKYVPDFLSVRGWAILILLFSKLFLDAAYLQPQPSRLFLVSFIYLMITAALYFGAVPYQLKNLSDWFYQKSIRARSLALAFMVYGSILAIAAFTY